MKIYLVIVLLAFSSCDMFLAGSYPYAESYRFECSRSELIERIAEFKKVNPEFQPVQMSKDSIVESYPKDGQTDFFYHFYFYIDSLNLYIHCAMNKNEQNPTDLLFTGVTKSKNMAYWKRINEDLPRKENKMIKKIFESEILDNLGKWK